MNRLLWTNRAILKLMVMKKIDVFEVESLVEKRNGKVRPAFVQPAGHPQLFTSFTEETYQVSRAMERISKGRSIVGLG